MEKHLKLLLSVFLLITTILGVGVVVLGKNQQAVSSFAAPIDMPPDPMATRPVPTPSTVFVISPDGKMTLTMKTNKKENETIWTFLADGKEILTETLPSEGSFSVPFNTFSPDNKYIFLQKTVGGGVTYPVLSTTGDDISKDGKAAEIASLFSSKFPEYKISEATGWGGINLVIFNTQKTDGSPGPSFWFEVPSHAFIKLSNTFH